METVLTLHRKGTLAIAQAIKAEASINPLFKMVCAKFASRERNRNTLTPSALKLAMAKSELNYPKQSYSDILRFMASIGLGKLEVGPRGQIRALNRIPVNLRTIGEMAQNIPAKEEAPIIPAQQASPAQKIIRKAKVGDFQLSYSSTLVLQIGREELRISGVQKIHPDKLGKFIEGFQALCRASEK